MDFHKLVEQFEKMIKDNGKTKFEQWFYDLSFKSTIAVVIFTLGLIFTLVYPWMNIILVLILVTQFYIDKYNLMYIYPLEFESQTISRKTLVKNSFFAIILFQLVMVSFTLIAGNVLSYRAIIYLISFVLIQLVMIITIFEFMRRPWQGVEIELEKALELQQNKILEDSISFISLNQNVAGQESEPTPIYRAKSNKNSGGRSDNLSASGKKPGHPHSTNSAY